jgi:methylated-DNA-[protein]-cysteine S-methyltransferase
MIYDYEDSPVGRLLLVRHDRDDATGSPGGLAGLYLPTGRHAGALRPDWQPDEQAFDDVRGQLSEYFAGERRSFDLPLSATGTEFQRRVWAALIEIPYGQTTTYGAVAGSLGSPGASRAVGLANGQNPISIIVPCHRVIGADGSMTGYGGGVPAKQWLLAHELQQAGLFV